MSTIEYLNKKISSSIKITDAMGIVVSKFNETSLTLSAPIRNNINDKGTAFAGSLYSLLVLASWALLEGCLKKEEIDADVMVTESSVEFKKAVHLDFAAKASFADFKNSPNFSILLSDNGKAKINMISEIMINNKPTVIFKGSFFIKRTN